MCYRNYPTIIVSFISIIFAHKYLSACAFEPNLKVHIFPVGEGEATIVECTDKPSGNITLTLINAGSMNTRKGEIQFEYLKFVVTKLKDSNYNLHNIILTSSDPKHYNFIDPLMILMKEEDVKNITFYIGGERSDYISLDHIFQRYDNVYEFTREDEVDKKVNSCGHLDSNEQFHTCVKRNKKGPVEKSDQVIKICDNFQITIMAANYGLSKNYKGEGEKSFNQRNYENSLVLKLTPSQLPSPSVLLGDIGNDLEDGDLSNKYVNFIKQAHSYYFTRSDHTPSSLFNGVTSTLLVVPRNGAAITSTQNENFYTELVQPKYAVISSDITDLQGHPRCSVLRLLSRYMAKFSTGRKTLQCHNRKAKDLEDTQVSELSDNLYQTSTVISDEHSRAKVAFKLITFKMTLKDVSKPVERPLIRNKRNDVDVHDITYLSARTPKNRTRMVNYLVNNTFLHTANASHAYFHTGSVDKRLIQYAGRLKDTFKDINYSKLHSGSERHKRCINESKFENEEYSRNCSSKRSSHFHSDKGRRSEVNTTNTNRIKRRGLCVNATGGKVDKNNTKDGNNNSYDVSNVCLTTLPTSEEYIKRQNKSKVERKTDLSSNSKTIESNLMTFSTSDRNNFQNYSNKNHNNNSSNTSKEKHVEYTRRHKGHVTLRSNSILKRNNKAHSFNRQGHLYKKYTISGKSWEDVSGLNDVSDQEKKFDNYNSLHKRKYNEKENDGNRNNEYREDIGKHNEHTYHTETNENNNYNNQIEKQNHHDNYNDAIDDMTMHSRRYNDYPDYETTTRDKSNVENDDFDYQQHEHEHELENSYLYRDNMLYPTEHDERDHEGYAFVNGFNYHGNGGNREKEDQQNIKEKRRDRNRDRAREGYAFVNGFDSSVFDYDAKEKADQHDADQHGTNEKRKDKGKESQKSSEPPDYESTLRGGYESVSNEYVSHNDHERQSPYYFSQGKDKSDDNFNFHYSPSQESGRVIEESVGFHKEEMDNQYNPTHHGHLDFDDTFGELGDAPSSERLRHTTSNITKDKKVKALKTHTDISPSAKQTNDENTISPHTHQMRKGIPTPVRKKSQKVVERFHKPTLSFREAKHNERTKQIHSGDTSVLPKIINHSKLKETRAHEKTGRKVTTTTQRARGKNMKKTQASKNNTKLNNRPLKGGRQKEKPPPPLQKKLHSTVSLRVPKHDPKKLNILCFGDSLTAGYNKRGKDFFPYCTALKEMLSSNTDLPVNVDIKGIVGEMTHKQMSYRLPLVLGNATSQYDWIIILGGTNDILHVKNFADDQYFLSQLENVWQPRIEKDIEKLHLISYKYNARTILLTVPENAIETWPEYKPLKRMRNKINDALKHFASSSNGRTVLCDTAKIVPRHSLNSEEENLLWDDHVHMTRSGYIKLASAVAECLGPFLPKKRSLKSISKDYLIL